MGFVGLKKSRITLVHIGSPDISPYSVVWGWLICWQYYLNTVRSMDSTLAGAMTSAEESGLR